MTKEEFEKYPSDFIPLKSLGNVFGINKYSQVINFKTGNILSPYTGVDLYQHIVLKNQGRTYRKRVHRLMAEAFFNNCKYIDHIDANKSNNRLDNLQAVTNSKNVKKAYEQNTYINPHKGRGIWIIATNKKTNEKYNFKSLRQCEEFTKIDRHRISLFLKNERPNYTDWNFEYDE